MQLEVRHLQLVKAVAEDGSLTKAGERLHLTQSALSHQLLDLEERLGTKLFHRASKRMVLTPAGERVLTTATRVLEDLRHAEEEVQLLATERRGLLRLTTECYTCYHWLPALLARFGRKHPGVEVRIDVEATKRALPALLEGSIDLALVTTDDVDRRIRLEPLFEDEMLLIVAPDNSLAEREFVGAKEIAACTLLTYATLDDATVYERVLRPAGVAPKQHMRVPLTEAMIELVRGGMGVAVVARWSVQPQLDAGAIAGVRVTRRGLMREWKAATLRSAASASYLDDFTAMLAAQKPKERTVTLRAV